MASVRWGVIAAIIALVISIFMGLIGGVAPFYIFLRGIVFTILFFGLGFAIRFMINSYYPELMYMNDETAAEDNEQTGTHVNITLDSAGEYAVPELYKTPGDAGELGNIDDLISGNFRANSGVDSKPEDSYNIDTGFVSDPVSDSADSDSEQIVKTAPVFVQNEPAVFTPSFGDGSEDLGGLPDLDAMMMAFSSAGGSPVPSHAPASLGGAEEFIPMAPPSAVSSAEPDRSQYKGNKPQELEGNFNPKELAEGIRTVLNKDN